MVVVVVVLVRHEIGPVFQLKDLRVGWEEVEVTAA